MPFDPVPWLVGGGAEHSPEVSRVLAYAALNGNEGVLGRNNFKVTAMSTPAARVQVAPGTCGILARGGGVNTVYQAYVGRMTETTPIDIAGTGASGRSDMIVARVEDPFRANTPWADPANPATGPYIFLRVIPNVPANSTSFQDLNRNEDGIPLARIDIPPNTSTITNDMITNLRFLANPRVERRLYSSNPTSTNRGPTSSTFVAWPSQSTWNCPIPNWAYGVKFAWVVSGVLVERSSTTVDGTVAGGMRITLGGSSGVVSQEAGYDVLISKTVTNLRTAIAGADTRDVTNSNLEALTAGLTDGERATAVLRFEARRLSGNEVLIADATGTSIQLQVEFFEQTT